MEEATYSQLRVFMYLSKKHKCVSGGIAKQGNMFVDFFTGVGTFSRMWYRRNGTFQWCEFQNKKTDYKWQEQIMAVGIS